jgi:ribonucleoside-diphosphate reductase alpha chain
VAALQVIRRNGAVVEFNPEKISLALTKAFLAVEGSQSAVSSRVREVVARLTDTVVRSLTRRLPDGGTVPIEDIQDQVELALMRAGEHDVARAYVLYRERRASERAAYAVVAGVPSLHVTVDGERRPLDVAALLQTCEAACAGLGEGVSAQTILDQALKNLYDGVALADVQQALILAARTLIEREPGYDYATARLLLASLREEALGQPPAPVAVDAEYLPIFIKRGIAAELLDPRLAEFDLARLAAALKPERDHRFGYLGLQTLYDRYFLHIDGRRIELPQIFFMRVAMGLALNEINRETQAIAF